MQGIYPLGGKHETLASFFMIFLIYNFFIFETPLRGPIKTLKYE